MPGAAFRPDPGVPLARWTDVRVRYPHAERDAVGPVSLSLATGERMLLLGPSGCGKSTLLQTLTGIIPQSVPASLDGGVELAGLPVNDRSPSAWAGTVAQLFQDPEQTLCGLRVEDEIAFFLENCAVPPDRMSVRINAAMKQVGLPEDWRRRRTTTLSGGERQLVALASTLVHESPIFVADEPTASLAPVVARRMTERILAQAARRSVLIVDHRMGDMLRHVDKVAVLNDDGTLLAQGAPGTLFRRHGSEMDRIGIWTPLASRLDRALCDAGIVLPSPPVTTGNLLVGVNDLPADRRRDARSVIAAGLRRPERKGVRGDVVAELKGAACAPLFGPVVLCDISLSAHAGEVLGILGPNGAGKSTLGASLAGLLRLKAGRRAGLPGGLAFQSPENQFTEASVRDEITRACGDEDRAQETLADWDLTPVAHEHPFELSQGQKRRLALATLTASDRWPLLVLDEPTAGLDHRAATTLAKHVRRLAEAGRSIAVITHDMEFAWQVCDTVAILHAGRLLAHGPAQALLRQAERLDLAGLSRPEVVPVLDWLEHGPC